MRRDRRQVTVLFADLAGSTALTESVDPEEAAELLGRAVRRIIERVDAFGGTVKDLAGDGVVALFGAPDAHEDDAERAVLCALQIVGAGTNVAAGPLDLRAHVGVATGEVVVGPVGGGSHVEFGAVGDALNTAARLQGRAAAGEVLVDAATRELVASHFRWGPERELDLKGKARSVAAAPVISRARVESPVFEESELVGRGSELSRILEVLRPSEPTCGRVIMLEGQPGVGKSRLINEVLRRVVGRRTGLGCLAGGAVSYGAAMPYLPLRTALLRWLDVDLDLEPADLRHALHVRAGQLPTVVAALTPLEPLLVGSSSTEGEGTPEQQQRRVFDALHEVLRAVALAANPALLVLEDLHWADPTTWSFLDELVRRLDAIPLMVVLTARPVPATHDRVLGLASASAGSDPLLISLGPLELDDSRTLLRNLLRGGELSPTDERQVLGVTQGNPFFIEEQVRALEASGALVWNGVRLTVDQDIPVRVAPTVQHALLSRVDALPPSARAALVAASVLGERFPARLLADVLGGDPQPALTLLEQRDLVRSAGSSEAPDVVFGHALVLDAVYSTLLRDERQRLHGDAARALERRYEGRTREIAGTLARHHEAAGDLGRAFGFYVLAAQDDAAACCSEETAVAAGRALSLVEPWTASAGPARAEIVDLLTLRAGSLRHLARYSEAVTDLQSAVALLDRDHRVARAALDVQIGEVLRDAHEYDAAIEAFGRALTSLGDPPSDDELDVWLDAQLGRCGVDYFLNRMEDYWELMAALEPIVRERGTRRQLLRFLDSARAVLWRRDRYVVSEELLALDAEVYAAELASDDASERAWGDFSHGFTLLWHGDLEEAEPYFAASSAAAHDLDDAMLQARALTYLMVVDRLRGDVAGAEVSVERVLAAAQEAGLPEYVAMARATAAWANWRRGQEPIARADAEVAMEMWESLPNRYFFDWMACLPLVALALDSADLVEAIRWTRPMLADSQQPLPAEVQHLLAEAVLAADSADPRATERALTEALSAAREIGRL